MASRRRGGFNVGLQRSVVLSLIAGGLGFAALAILAAWLVTAVGRYTPRATAPVLHAYLEAAAAGDAEAAHRLLSQNALRETPLEALAELLEDRQAYGGFVGLRVFRVVERPPVGGVPVETAQVRATGRYRDGSRRPIAAVLEREGGDWYIRDLVVGQPAEPVP